ncbi:MAG: hypothetical protein Q4D17_00755, partial [Planctomycetia bacterium]|nr:hypothetical protein [Planctomycetia bacterium]
MEMLRTVIVALFFAGITVCSYYFLSSSTFPWENEGTSIAQTDISGENTQNGEEIPRTFESENASYEENPALAKADSPFAVPQGSESDEFGLPGLEELPAPQAQENNENLASAAPVLDTDLPSLGSVSEKSPFETVPEAVSAAPESHVGTGLDSQILPPNTDLPPGPRSPPSRRR